ncbi:MAG TPA: bi-domain-containing oxidoreductase [Blastocatellia bacterium]|nr:bi-domain-containing oxidoreductase [Blastocatellia bacterium]
MEQVLRKGLKHIVVEEVPDPMALPNHVLIRPVYSLISSGTETSSIHLDGVLKEVTDNPSHLRKIWDVMKVNGPTRTVAEVRAKFAEYVALGYSGAGVVCDKHDAVMEFDIGDRVAYGGEGTGHAETILAGKNLVVKVPDSVPFEHACFTTLGSIALNAVRISNISVGDVVAVIGLGLVGQLIAQLARLQGGMVIAIDLKTERVNLARQLGADAALVGNLPIAEQINSITNGRGADCVIVAAASKSDAPARQALQICKDRGRLVIVGAVNLNFPWDQMYLKEIQLFMSRAYGPGSYDPAYEVRGQDYPVSYVRWTEKRNMEEFLRLVALKRVQIEPLITHKFPLKEAAKAYETIMDFSSESLAVVLRYPAADSEQQAPDFKPRRRVETSSEPAKRSDIQVALVGAGNIARWAHLPSLKSIPGVRLQAVLSNSGARGKSLATRFGAAYACSDYEEILRDPNIDVVMIMSRNQYHFSQARAALQAGKHVFLEKPMSLTEEESRVLFRTVEETGKHFTIGFNRRFAPLYAEQKRHLMQRTGPAVVNCRVNSPGISGSYWMADPAIGGAILGEACHFTDLMYWLLESEPVSVSAYSLPTGKDDPIGQNNIVASFRFEDGSIGNLTYCTVGGRASGERVEAFAQGVGVCARDFKHLEIQTRITRRQSSWWPDKGYKQQLATFMEGVRTGKPQKVTALDGVRSTVVGLRILEAAQTGNPCAIDLYAALQ